MNIYPFVFLFYFCDSISIMENFDDIRPYRDEEFQETFSLLAKEQQFVSVLKYVFQDRADTLINMLKTLTSIDDLQANLIKPFLDGVINKSTQGVTFTGTENIPREKPCLFISNHRDIVLDPSLIDYGLHVNNIPTVEIAIGSNLLIMPWIELLVRLNKSFIVRRDVTGRQLLLSSMHLSSYIRHSVTECHRYIWIAQREGRAKDGNDLTQDSLLRMLAMSGKSKDMRQALMPLNIVPITISYEYDPCDGMKAAELAIKASNQPFTKTPDMDLQSMVTGIKGNKGHVNIHFGKPINEDLAKCAENDVHKQASAIAKIIDQAIFQSYSLYDSHKVAYNLMTGTDHFSVSKEKTTEIQSYFLKQLANSGLTENELPFIVMQYANQTKNYLSVTGKV